MWTFYLNFNMDYKEVYFWWCVLCISRSLIVANCSAQRCSFSERSICSGVNIFFVDSLCFSSLLISGMGKSRYTFSFSATTINLQRWKQNKQIDVELGLEIRILNSGDSIFNPIFANIFHIELLISLMQKTQSYLKSSWTRHLTRVVPNPISTNLLSPNFE